MSATLPKRVLSVGGNDILTHPLPAHYHGYLQEVLDIDPNVGAAIVCDAREIQATQKPGTHDAIYCSHNLEHYYAHDVEKVLKGFLHLLKPHGFVEIWVPDIPAVMQHAVARDLCLEDVLYDSPAGPILLRDVIYGWGKEIEESGQEFYAHKTGFSKKSMRAALMRAGFAAVFDIQRGAGFEIGVLGFKTVPQEKERRLFGLDALERVQST